jgi:hypothetical protein
MSEKPLYRRYWPVPYMAETTYEYQDINKSMTLRNDVVDFFYSKVKKWSKKSVDKSNIYSLLRNYVKKNNCNWYDLRSLQYSYVKDYILSRI